MYKTYEERMMEERHAQNRERAILEGRYTYGMNEHELELRHKSLYTHTVCGYAIEKSVLVTLKRCKCESDTLIDKRCFHAIKGVLLFGKIISSNTIIYFDTTNELCVCDHFPSRSYHGDNPWLTIWRLNRLDEKWYECVEQNATTRTMFKAYKLGGYKKFGNTFDEQVSRGDANFHPVTKKKHSLGSRPFNEYKEMTDYECVGKGGKMIKPERYYKERLGI